jgi:hypothetical protein
MLALCPVRYGTVFVPRAAATIHRSSHRAAMRLHSNLGPGSGAAPSPARITVMCRFYAKAQPTDNVPRARRRPRPLSMPRCASWPSTARSGFCRAREEANSRLYDNHLDQKVRSSALSWHGVYATVIYKYKCNTALTTRLCCHQIRRR